MSLEQLTLGGLPPELLHLIFSHISEPKDLLSLCETSRLLYTVAQHSLYKRINTCLYGTTRLTPDMIQLDLSAHVKLFRTVQSEIVGSLVTKFSIIFSSSWIHRHPDPCGCNDFDAQLGQALVSLRSLRSLGFSCMCCSFKNIARHRYLGDLKSTQLDQLSFFCTCHQHPTGILHFLSKPCFSLIKSLNLYERSPALDAGVLADTSLFPHLEKISTTDLEYANALMSGRSITHLLIERAFGASRSLGTSRSLESLCQTIQDNPANLIYLTVVDLSDDIIASITTKPFLYLNLEHLGVLGAKLVDKEEESFFEIEKITSSLPKLRSIEVNITSGPQVTSETELFHHLSDEGFLPRMDRSPISPVFNKVYIKLDNKRIPVRKFWIMELLDSRWQIRMVNPFTSWDIIHNRAY